MKTTKRKNFTLLQVATVALTLLPAPAQACGSFSWIQWAGGGCSSLDWMTTDFQGVGDTAIAKTPQPLPAPAQQAEPTFEVVQIFPARFNASGFQVQAIVNATNPTDQTMDVDAVFALGNAKKAERFKLGPSDSRPITITFSFVDGNRTSYSKQELQWTVR